MDNQQVLVTALCQVPYLEQAMDFAMRKPGSWDVIRYPSLMYCELFAVIDARNKGGWREIYSKDAHVICTVRHKCAT